NFVIDENPNFHSAVYTSRSPLSQFPSFPLTAAVGALRRSLAGLSSSRRVIDGDVGEGDLHCRILDPGDRPGDRPPWLPPPGQLPLSGAV
ncbi:hypothetical protein BHM03_00049557, partial [Ensete ventricosum]